MNFQELKKVFCNFSPTTLVSMYHDMTEHEEQAQTEEEKEIEWAIYASLADNVGLNEANLMIDGEKSGSEIATTARSIS